MMGMPSCKEVGRAISGGAFDEAPLARRAVVKLHLLMCRHCGRYATQLRTIGSAARDLVGRPGGEEESVHRLRQKILDHIELAGATAPDRSGRDQPPK